MGRPKKKEKDIRIVGYIPPNYYTSVQEISERTRYKSFSEIVSEAIINFVLKFHHEESAYQSGENPEFKEKWGILDELKEETNKKREKKQSNKKK